MPIYEYRRPDGTTFEVVQSFSDEPLAADPDTGVPVERVLHAPAVHFKGKGFYNTDYGTRKRQRESSTSSESASSESSASTSTESSGGVKKNATDSSSAKTNSSESSPSEKKESGGKAEKLAAGSAS